jgi:hypothetical protein
MNENFSEEPLDILLADENKIVIVFLLYMFGSLNLKMIAKLLDRTEPPILRWIKMMLDEGLIIIDVEATEKSRGKFYKLSKNAEEFFDIDTFPNPNKKHIDEQSKKQEREQGINLLRSLGTLMNMLMKITANFFGDKIGQKKDQDDFKKGKFNMFSSFSMLHFQSEEDVQNFKKKFDEFNDQICKKYDLKDNEEPKFSHSLFFSVTPIFKIREKLEAMKKNW